METRFFLTSGKRADAQVFFSLQAHVRNGGLHALFKFLLRNIGAGAQLRRIAERGADGKIVVHDILLRHVPDYAFVRVHVFVIIVGVVINFAAGGRTHSVDAIEHGGFTCAAPADDGDKIPRSDAEGNVGDQ